MSIELNKIYNEKCSKTLGRMISEGQKVDLVLTSPPYNTGRPSNSERSLSEHEGRYDVHLDNMTSEQYIKGITQLFNLFDKTLEKNGVVLWNVSYGSDATVSTQGIGLVWLSIADVIQNSPFTVADRIIWKKSSALPNNVSPNKLTRIVEDIFVFCRKDEYKTFNANKKVSKVGNRGQVYYKNYFNFIEAKNNDGVCPYNKATYSSDMCRQVLSIYAKKGQTVYDCFMGSGTTAVACKQMGLNYIGSEISENQVSFANERIAKTEVIE